MLAKGNIISFKMTGGGTGKDDNYSYYIREKDGEVLFDAYYRSYCDGGEVREVMIKNAVVTHEDMEKIRNWCNKRELAEKQNQQEQSVETARVVWTCAACGETGNKGKFCTECGKPPAGKDNAAKAGDSMIRNRQKDSTVVQIEAVWENNARFDTKMIVSVDDYSMGLTHLLFLFETLTKRLGGGYCSAPEKPAAEGKIVSLEFSYGGNGRNPFTAYRYYLREENGEILFDAHGYADNSRIDVNVEKAVVSREDIDAVIEICGGNSTLAEQQKDYAVAASSVYIVPPWREIYDRINEMQTTDGPFHKKIFEIVWENGAALNANTTFGSEEALKTFFYDLATRLEK